MVATSGLAMVGLLLWLGAGDNPLAASALLLVALGLATLSPAGALGAAVLAIPTAFAIHPLGIGSFSLLEVGIVTTAAGLALRLAAGGLASIRDAVVRVVASVEIVLPVLLLAGSALLALAMMSDTAHRTEALREIRLVFLEPLVFLASALVILREREARLYVWGCAVAAGTVIGLWAVFELAAGIGTVIDGTARRATATYSHPNNLALFLERIFLLTLPVLLRASRSWPILVCAGLQAAGIIATLSRGALIAVIVGAVVVMLLLGMRRLLGWLSGVVLVGGLVLLAVARNRLLDAGGSGEEPTRFAIWRSSWEMALDHPLFGVGPDQFLYQYSRRYVEPAAWPERYTSHPHNLPLDVWLRTGVAGLASFAALLAGLAVRVRASIQVIRADSLAVGGVAALAGGLAHGMVDNGYFLPDLAALTWLAVALVITAGPAVADRDR